MSWNDYGTRETRALRGISKSVEKPNKDVEKNLQNLNNSVRYMSQMMTVMQNGIDDANRDMIQIFTDAIEDLMIIFGLSDAGDTLNLDWGDLQVVLENVGAIFQLDLLGVGADIPAWAQALWDNLFAGLVDIDFDFEDLLLALQGTYTGDNVVLQNIATWASGLVGIIDMRRKVPLWQLFSENIEVIDNFNELSTIEEAEGWVWDETDGKDDLGCALFTSIGDMGVLLSPEPVEVRESEVYRVKAWAKGTAVDGSFTLGCQWYDENFQALHYSEAHVEDTPTPSWFHMEGTVTVPAGAKYCRRRFAANITTGQARIDNVRFKGDATTIPQEWVKDLVAALGALLEWIEQLVDQFLTALGLDPLGNLADKITDLTDEIELWLSDTEDRAAELANLITDLFSDPASILGMLPQSHITGLTTTFNQLQDLFNGIVVTPANSVVSAFKDWLGDLLGWQNQATETSINVQSQITTVQQIFSVRSNRPLWEGLDPTGDTTIPFSSLMATPYHDHEYSKPTTFYLDGMRTGFTGVSDFTISSSASICGCIRLESSLERSQITFLAKRSDTVTSLYLDLYRMNEDGSFTLLHSTDNLAGDLITTLTWQQVAIPPMLFEEGTVIMVQFRANANVQIAGIQLPAPANAFGFVPRQIGMERNGTAPSTITSGDANNEYSGKTPYVQIGANVGQLEAGRTFADTFNRTNLGTSWATGYRNGGQPLKILGDAIANPSSTIFNFRSAALYTMPLASDRIAVEWDYVGVNGEWSGVVLCASSSMTNYVVVGIKSGTVTISTVANSMNDNQVTVRANVSATTGNHWRMTYDPDDNTYRVIDRITDTVVASWTDSSNFISHGKGKRFCGVQIDTSGNGVGSRIDNWTAYDVAEEE